MEGFSYSFPSDHKIQSPNDDEQEAVFLWRHRTEYAGHQIGRLLHFSFFECYETRLFQFVMNISIYVIFLIQYDLILRTYNTVKADARLEDAK